VFLRQFSLLIVDSEFRSGAVPVTLQTFACRAAGFLAKAGIAFGAFVYPLA
jgi:biotin transporter BioY